MKVTIESDRGRLRLRWQHQGKRYVLSLGVADDATGKAVAHSKAKQIELDLTVGYFDPTLLKYKPRLLGKSATEVNVPQLFERYVQAMARDKALCNGSLERYRGCRSHVRRSLDIPVHCSRSR